MGLSAGTRLGPYEITVPLGAGGMGEVYRSRDTRLGRDVAIKILPQHFTATPEARARFEREARTISKINHPNVCTLYDVGREGEMDFLVMELIEGGSLGDRLAREPLALEQVLDLGIEIADALETAHSKGVVHRDLKPSNILVTDRGHAKVMDFGLATAARRGARPAGVSGTSTTEAEEHLTSPGVALGTVAYMSPEQARGEEVDARSDLFSLGSVLFEMVTGRRAFIGETSAVIFDGILNRTPAPVTELRLDVPIELDRIVGKSLEKDKDLRFQTAGELRSDLKRLKRDLDSARARALGGAPGAAAVPGKRTRRWLLALGVATLVLVGFAALVWIRGAGRGGHGEPTLTRVGLAQSAAASGRGAQPVLSPDGRLLAYAQNGSLCLASVESGDVRVVVEKEEGSLRCVSADWHPDGRHLVSQEIDAEWNLRIVLTDFVTSQRQVIAKLSLKSLGWGQDVFPVISPDGRYLAMLGGPTMSAGQFRELWIVDLRTNHTNRLVRVGDQQEIYPPVWSPDSRRLAFLVRGPGWSRSALETCGLDGQRIELLPDREGRLIPSGSNYRSILWLPDWRLVYHWRYEPASGQGAAELRFLRVNSRSWHAIGKSYQLYRLPGWALVLPSATADGTKLAFIAKRNPMRVQLLGIGRGADHFAARPAVDTDWEDGYPVWSRDGSRLFLGVNKSGNDHDVYVCEMKTGITRPILATGASETPICLTPDGLELLCSQGPRLLSISVAGGPPRTVADTLDGRVFCATAPDTLCLFVQRAGTDLVFRAFHPIQGVGSELFRRRKQPAGDLIDLSPNGRRIVLGGQNQSSAAILETSSGKPLNTVEIRDSGIIQSMRWAPDGQSILMSGMVGVAPYWLKRVSLDGREGLLWKSANTWAIGPVPSPDGKRLAFAATEFSAAMWILEGF